MTGIQMTELGSPSAKPPGTCEHSSRFTATASLFVSNPRQMRQTRCTNACVGRPWKRSPSTKSSFSCPWKRLRLRRKVCKRLRLRRK